jgi:hypothetical protein
MENKSVEYQKGYDIMISEGYTPEAIVELGDSKVESAYTLQEFQKGNLELHQDHCVVDDKGHLVRILEYEGFMGETYESACERIPGKIQTLIAEDAKARGLEFTPSAYEEIIMEYSHTYGMDNELYDKVHKLAQQHADYLSERKALGLE